MAENISKITARADGAAIVCTDGEGGEARISGGGPHAPEMLLMAAAGCNMSIVKALAKRDGLILTKLAAAVEGTRSETAPKRFTDIHISLEVEGPGLTEEKMNKYVKIAESTCPVTQSLNSKVTVDYKIIG
ncbi:MAG: OsmC family protein [Chloroflexota bacterium]